jgi:hypothetical protein
MENNFLETVQPTFVTVVILAFNQNVVMQFFYLLSTDMPTYICTRIDLTAVTASSIYQMTIK